MSICFTSRIKAFQMGWMGSSADSNPQFQIPQRITLNLRNWRRRLRFLVLKIHMSACWFRKNFAVTSLDYGNSLVIYLRQGLFLANTDGNLMIMIKIRIRFVLLTLSISWNIIHMESGWSTSLRTQLSMFTMKLRKSQLLHTHKLLKTSTTWRLWHKTGETKHIKRQYPSTSC